MKEINEGKIILPKNIAFFSAASFLDTELNANT